MAKVEVELKKLHKILVDSDYSYQVPDYQRPKTNQLVRLVRLDCIKNQFQKDPLLFSADLGAIWPLIHNCKKYLIRAF
ncbi:hypothetical protein HpBT0082_14730 [Helicobacter pylori]